MKEIGKKYQCMDVPLKNTQSKIMNTLFSGWNTYLQQNIVYEM